MGEIITFYSYKGGTGRSMALANTAVLLAKQNKRVLMIDWDLEAPGLDAYFLMYRPDMPEQNGLIEYFKSLRLGQIKYGSENNDNNMAALDKAFHKIHSYCLAIPAPDCGNNLFLLKAGKQDADYQTRLQRFDWKGFFTKRPAFFSLFAHYLSEQFEYVLIDSRTGHTDIGSICTALLPEKLVLVFTPNEQSLKGVLTIAQNVANYRIKSDDLRPLMIYPLPSRVDLGEDDKKREWESRYKNDFKEIFVQIYGLPPNSNLEEYFSEVQIPYLPRFSYGESLSTLEPNGPNSITDNYEYFYNHLIKNTPIWNTQVFEGTPFELNIIYDDNNNTEKDILLTQLSVFRRINMLRWEDDNLLTIENWDTNFIRKLTTKNDRHLVLILINESLQIEIAQEPQLSRIKKMVRQANFTDSSLIFFPIWTSGELNPEILELFIAKPIYPNRRKPLNSYEDQDEAWNIILTAIRTQLLIKS